MRHHCHPLGTPAPCTGSRGYQQKAFPQPFITFRSKTKTDISVCAQLYSLPLPYPITCFPEGPFAPSPEVSRWMSCSSSGVNPTCEWVGDVTSCYDPQGLPTQCEEGNTEKPTEEREIKVSGRITRFYTDYVVLEYTGKLITCKF